MTTLRLTSSKSDVVLETELGLEAGQLEGIAREADRLWRGGS